MNQDDQIDVVALGHRLRAHRRRRALTLDELAQLSGVSRSMLSEVERGSRVPTVLTLDRIATGLGTSIARLLRAELPTRVTVLRRQEQDVVRDPSGWERRILSPVLPEVEFEFMRTTLGPGVDAGTFTPHAPGSREYLAVETGLLQLSLDDQVLRLAAGDSVYYAGDCRHGFVNPGDQPCVYYLAMDVTGDAAQHLPAAATDGSVGATDGSVGAMDESVGAMDESVGTGTPVAPSTTEGIR